MARSTRFVLGVVAAMLGVLLVAAAIGGYFLYRLAQDAVDIGKTQLARGEERGRKTDNAGCLREAVAQQEQDESLRATLAHSFFLSGCLKSSEPTAGFCDDVPKPSELIRTVQWTLRQCAQAGIEGDTCHTLFQAVQRHCEKLSGKSEDEAKR